MSKRILWNKNCVAFIGDTQECIKLLDDIGYKFRVCKNSLQKDYDKQSLILTFNGGKYTIVDYLPSPNYIEDNFDNIIVPRTFEEFKKLVEDFEIVELKNDLYE